MPLPMSQRALPILSVLSSASTPRIPSDIAAHCTAPHRIASHRTPRRWTRLGVRREGSRGEADCDAAANSKRVASRRVALQLCSDTEYCTALHSTVPIRLSYRIVSTPPPLCAALPFDPFAIAAADCTRSPAAALCSCGGWRTLGSSGIGGAAPLPAAGF